MLEGISCKKELFSGGDGVLYENITIRADKANTLTIFKQQ